MYRERHVIIVLYIHVIVFMRERKRGREGDLKSASCLLRDSTLVKKTCVRQVDPPYLCICLFVYNMLINIPICLFVYLFIC